MPLEEIWRRIPEFPTYSISSLGNVMNNVTSRDMHLTLTKQGDVKVGLVKGGKQYTRSVKVLVAEAFVEGKSELFNTPVQLDGYQANNQYHNIVWRPRWFAWKYTRQFSEPDEIHKIGPIYDINTKIMYDDIYEAAIANGLLMHDIWRSINTGVDCFPTGQRFAPVPHEGE